MNRSARSLLALPVALAMLHCSGGDDPPRAPSSPQPDGSTLPTVDGGAGGGDATTGKDGGDIPAEDAELSFTDVASTACKPTTAVPVALLPDDTNQFFTDLGRVGDRRVARGILDEGYLTFDGAGGSVTPATRFFDNNRAASAGGAFFSMVALDGPKIYYGRFGATGTAVSDKVTVAPELAQDVIVGRAGDAALVAWSVPKAVRARALDANGAVDGAIFELESDSEKDDFSARIAPSAAKDGSTFAVAWAVRRAALGQHRLYFALVKAGAMVGLPLKLYGSPERIQVSGLAATASGYTILLNLDGEAAVASLTARGLPAAAGHRFKGGRDALVGAGLSLATRDDAVLLGAERDSGQTAVRVLEPSGKPKGGWVCLTAPDPDAYQFVSVDRDGAGYAAIAATPAGGTAFFKLDATANEP